jgi:hypothetical protein
MPNVLRPRHEFPTPLFRVWAGCGSAVLGAAPARRLVGGITWNDGRRLAVAFGAMLLVDVVAVVIVFLAVDWE